MCMEIHSLDSRLWILWRFLPCCWLICFVERWFCFSARGSDPGHLYRSRCAYHGQSWKESPSHHLGYLSWIPVFVFVPSLRAQWELDTVFLSRIKVVPWQSALQLSGFISTSCQCFTAARWQRPNLTWPGWPSPAWRYSSQVLESRLTVWLKRMTLEFKP